METKVIKSLTFQQKVQVLDYLRTNKNYLQKFGVDKLITTIKKEINIEITKGQFKYLIGADEDLKKIVYMHVKDKTKKTILKRIEILEKELQSLTEKVELLEELYTKP